MTSERYRKQRDKLNANSTESPEYIRIRDKLDNQVEALRRIAQQKIKNRPTGKEARYDPKYGAEDILKRNKEKEMSKKKALNLPVEQPADKPVLASEPLPEPEPLTTVQIIKRTKISRADLKRFYDFGLFQNIDADLWPHNTVDIIKQINDYVNQGVSINDIHAKLYPKPNRVRDKVDRVPKLKPTFQEVRVINSKRTKFDDTYNVGQFDLLDKIRIFGTLKYPPLERRDVILHIPIRLNRTGSSHGHRDSDIDCLEKNLEIFQKHEGFRGELVISVNGFVEPELIPDVKYLREIHGSQIGPFNTIVFQRPNYGYQWGGFYDVWLKYKNLPCEYYATLECDCWLTGDWFQKCMENINHRGFLGMPPKSDLGGQTDTYFFVPRIWKNSDGNEIRQDDYRPIMTHTRGGFYFCKKETLKRLDESYGCFTESMSSDLYMDGIAMGEIGFASKIKQCGFEFDIIDHIVACSENSGWPEDLKT